MEKIRRHDETGRCPDLLRATCQINGLLCAFSSSTGDDRLSPGFLHRNLDKPFVLMGSQIGKFSGRPTRHHPVDVGKAIPDEPAKGRLVDATVFGKGSHEGRVDPTGLKGFLCHWDTSLSGLWVIEKA